MAGNLKISMEKIEKTISALKKHNINAFYVENSCKAVELVSSLLSEGQTISFGGSETLKESGIMDLIKSGKYNVLDRFAPGVDPQEVYTQTINADAYFSSSNAITENGELYNVDGFANRVSAITFGPRKVFIVAGYNKIVKDLDEAVLRVKTIASPKNCVRLSKDTYCAKFGKCVSLLKENSGMTDGCDSDGRICRHYVVTAKQPKNDRINVIIIGEELGY